MTLSRVLMAGDGSLLVMDDLLLDPLVPEPSGERSPEQRQELEQHPLIRIARHILADSRSATPGTGDLSRTHRTADQAPSEVTVRIVHADTGQLAAVEVSGPGSLATPLTVRAWCYPQRLDAVPESPAAAAAVIAGDATSLLLPGMPAFVSGLRELYSEGRAMRDLRVVRAAEDAIPLVRFYGWLSTDPGHPGPIGVSLDLTPLRRGPTVPTDYFEGLIAAVPESILVMRVSGDVVWSNGRFSELLGYPPDVIANYGDFRSILHPADRRALDELTARLRNDPAEGPGEARCRLRDSAGNWRWLHMWLSPWLSAPDGEVSQFVCTFRDVDEAVRAELRMAWEASHDPLTGLANRRAISETLQDTADDPDDRRRHLYFIDLDDFKKVNDACGHSAGDDLLRTLASRISMLVAPADLVGRFGGDELVIISSMPPTQLGDRLLAAIRRPVTAAGSEFTVTSSIGVARIAVAEAPGDVVRRANDAMYSAKRVGGNRYAIAGPLNTGPAQRRVTVESELRRAIASASDQLQVVFQPIVEANRVPVAAEALVRWQHPTRGTLLPAEFLDVAEAADLMSELSELVVRQSLAAVAAWSAAGRPLMVTVNAGRRELGNGRLAALLIEGIERNGIHPEQVCVEVTESVLVDAGSPELAELWRLRDAGLEIALDDFGTGYAPLTYLKRLPATILKLDKSFVAGLGLPIPNPVDLAVSRAVCRLAEEVGLRVVAEGVESEGQLKALSAIGYRYFQGFWAHPPMSAQLLQRIVAAA